MVTVDAMHRHNSIFDGTVSNEPERRQEFRMMAHPHEDNDMDERQVEEKKQAHAERLQLRKDREAQRVKLRKEQDARRKTPYAT
jgi:predicted alpha/beta superfamily hydrolase